MGLYRLGLTFQSYSVTGTVTVADHPAANLTVLRRPFLSWAATDGTDGAHDLLVDFGSAVTVPGAYWGDGNFAAVGVECGDDGITWPDSLGLFLIPRDPDTGRRKVWTPWAMPTARRYLHVIPFTWDGVDEVAFPGVTGFALGTLAFPNPAEAMVQNWGEDVRKTVRQSVTRVPSLGGGGTTNREGRRYCTFELQGPWRETTRTQMRRLQDVELGQPFFMAQESDTPDYTQAWILERVADVEWASRFKQYDASWSLAECLA